MSATAPTFRTVDGTVSATLQPQPDGALGVDLAKLPADPVGGVADPGHPAPRPARPPTTTAPTTPAEPTPAELAVNFGAAMGHWVAAGLPVVTEATYRARSAACEPCELWDGRARFGLGKCKAPGCGCTKFKRWLATETCKHPQGTRWPAVP